MMVTANNGSTLLVPESPRTTSPNKSSTLTHTTPKALSPISPKTIQYATVVRKDVDSENNIHLEVRRAGEFNSELLKYNDSTPLGKGSYGDVYKGTFAFDNIVVAVKDVNVPKIEANGLEKFLEREISIQQQLDCEYIVKMMFAASFDLGERCHTILVLEFCNGGDLHQYLQSVDGKLDDKETIHFIHDVSAALEYLAERNVVHRDIKEANILLHTPPDRDRRLFKLTDLGLTRCITESDPGETLCGTPRYFAPEVASHKKYGVEVDMWSLGTVLYKCTTGKHLFPGKNEKEVFASILKWKDDGGSIFDLVQESDTKLSSGLLVFIRKLLRGLVENNPEHRIHATGTIDHNGVTQDSLRAVALNLFNNPPVFVFRMDTCEICPIYGIPPKGTMGQLKEMVMEAYPDIGVSFLILHNNLPTTDPDLPVPVASRNEEFPLLLVPSISQNKESFVEYLDKKWRERPEFVDSELSQEWSMIQTSITTTMAVSSSSASSSLSSSSTTLSTSLTSGKTSDADPEVTALDSKINQSLRFQRQCIELLIRAYRESLRMIDDVGSDLQNQTQRLIGIQALCEQQLPSSSSSSSSSSSPTPPIASRASSLSHRQSTKPEFDETYVHDHTTMLHSAQVAHDLSTNITNTITPSRNEFQRILVTALDLLEQQGLPSTTSSNPSSLSDTHVVVGLERQLDQFKGSSGRLHDMMKLLTPVLADISNHLFKPDGLKQTHLLVTNQIRIMIMKHTEATVAWANRLLGDQGQSVNASQLNQLDKMRADREQELQKVLSQSTLLKESVEQQEACLVESKCELEQRETKLAQLQDEIAKSENKIVALKEQQEFEAQLAQELQLRTVKAETDLKKSESTLAEAASIAKTAQDKAMLLASNVAKDEEEAEQQKQHLASGISALQNEQNTLRESVQKLQDQKATLLTVQNEIQTLNQAKAKLEKDIADATWNRDNLLKGTEDLVTMKRELDELRDSHCINQLQINDLTAEKAEWVEKEQTYKLQSLVETTRINELEVGMKEMAERLAHHEAFTRQQETTASDATQALLQGRAKDGDLVLLQRVSQGNGSRQWIVMNSPTKISVDLTTALPGVLRSDDHTHVLAKVVFASDPTQIIVEALGPFNAA